MRSYQEIIKGDTFDKKDSYLVSGKHPKMCWGCETKHKEGYMVRDVSKMRSIFFCQDCYDKLNT